MSAFIRSKQKLIRCSVTNKMNRYSLTTAPSFFKLLFEQDGANPSHLQIVPIYLSICEILVDIRCTRILTVSIVRNNQSIHIFSWRMDYINSMHADRFSIERQLKTTTTKPKQRELLVKLSRRYRSRNNPTDTRWDLSGRHSIQLWIVNTRCRYSYKSTHCVCIQEKAVCYNRSAK